MTNELVSMTSFPIKIPMRRGHSDLLVPRKPLWIRNIVRLFVVVLIVFFPFSGALSVSSCHQRAAPRHVCLMDSYATVQGPYLTALLDQLIEQAGYPGLISNDVTMVACFCRQHDKNAIGPKHFEKIKDDLGISNYHHLILEDYDPLSLEISLAAKRPSLLWLCGDNPFYLRYRIRTSGLDRWIAQNCAGPLSENSKPCVYVGEAAGALCAGASMRVAHYGLHLGKGVNIPTEAPEPQFFGLELLGPDRTVAFVQDSVKDFTSIRSRHPELEEDKLLLLGKDQLYVWTQSSSLEDGSESVASFVFLPNQFGMMQQMTSPKSLLPLVDEEDDNLEDRSSRGGVPCFGEPSIDPSRQLHNAGDSDWFEYFDEA